MVFIANDQIIEEEEKKYFFRKNYEGNLSLFITPEPGNHLTDWLLKLPAKRQ